MYLTVKQQIKHLSKEGYVAIKALCRTAKSLTNEAIYNVRQYYFENKAYLDYNHKDIIPTYGNKEQTHKFSGKRICRGLYKTASGKILNADVNGTLNIPRKSNITSLKALYNRGDVDTPIRKRIV